MKKQFQRFAALLLTLTVLLQQIPYSTYAADISDASSPAEVIEAPEAENAAENTSVPSADGDEADSKVEEISDTDENGTDAESSERFIDGELANRRDEFSKQFRLTDGTFEAARYAVPVHFEENGQWMDIDNTLKLTESENGTEAYCVQNGRHSSSFFTRNDTAALFQVRVGDMSMTFTAEKAFLSDGTEAAEAAAERKTEVENGSDSVNEEPRDPNDVIPEALSSSIVYRDIYPGTDISYELFSYDLKETIILNNREAPATYSFLLDAEGIYPEIREDGSVCLLNMDGEMEYLIPPATIEDANGDAGSIEMSLEEAVNEGTGSQCWRITLKPDADWLNAEDRAYPVSIDPTLQSKETYSTLQATSATELGNPVSAAGNNNVVCGYNPTYGSEAFYLRFSSLPQIDPGCTIVGASLSLTFNGYSMDRYVYSTFAVHQVNESLTSDEWTNGVAWADHLAMDTEAPMDYIRAVWGPTYGFTYSPSGWNITRAVKNWYADTGTNYGIMVNSDQNSSNCSKQRWVKFKKTTAVLLLNYRSTLGVEDYYTYETVSADRAGTGYVGDYSSGLTVVEEDLTWPTTTIPFTLSHAYNTGICGGNLSDSSLSYLHNPDYSAMKAGAGWQLSCQESIRTITISDTAYLVYRDSDGTEHYCSKPGPSYYVYYDEDGLGLSFLPNDAECTMTDRDQILYLPRMQAYISPSPMMPAVSWRRVNGSHRCQMSALKTAGRGFV